MHENSQYPKFLETLKSIQQNFPVLWVKQIDAKTRQPPSFINSLLPTPEIFWNTDLTLKNFLVLWSKKTFRQNYMLPSFAWKPSMPDFFWNKEGFACEICRDYETKVFQRRAVISRLYAKNFFDNRIFLTQWMVPPQKCQHCETKKISTQKSDIPFIRKKFVDSRLCLKHWIVTPRNFSALWDFKNVQRKLVITISYAWKFSIPEVSRKIEEYPTKISGAVSQTNWRKNGTTPIIYQ